MCSVAGGARGFERGADPIYDAVQVREHLVVPEAEDGVAEGFEGVLASEVFGAAIEVAAPVEFYDEAAVGAVEVHDVVGDRLLAEEAHAELAPPKAGPQEAFGERRLVSEASGRGSEVGAVARVIGHRSGDPFNPHRPIGRGGITSGMPASFYRRYGKTHFDRTAGPGTSVPHRTLA